jgi:hypothetical protein
MAPVKPVVSLTHLGCRVVTKRWLSEEGQWCEEVELSTPSQAEPKVSATRDHHKLWEHR